MAWNKIWLGTTDEDFAVATNWQPISIRNPSFNWTQKGATGEYYVRATGPADPAFGAKPGVVYINGALAVEGTLGSLTAGQWCWGDPDTLGYDTVTVKVTGPVDPDTLARDYVQFQAVPNGSDTVTLSGLAVKGITSSLDQSALSAAAWFIEAGFRNLAIGSQSQPLRITPSSLITEGSGSQQWFINVGSANIAPEIRNCPTPSTNIPGLNLTGSNLAAVVHDAGSLALAGLTGETTTCAEIILRGAQAKLVMGAGLTWTTLRTFAGSAVARSNGTTIHATGGKVEMQLAMTVTTINGKGATIIDRSTGTVTTLTLDAGSYDTMQLTGAKTISTLKHNAGQLVENVDLLAITTRSEPDYAGTTTRQRA